MVWQLYSLYHSAIKQHQHGLLKIMGFPQHYGPMKYSALFFKVEHFYIVQKISKKKVDTNF